MKKTISILLLFSFIFLILIFPNIAVHAAEEGLILWYSTLLPTLLPLSILSNILISSGYLYYITKYLYAVVHPFYPVSQAGVFPLLAGLFFGFPLGSKITADLVAKKELSPEEGSILICISNNLSPAFISNYLFFHSLGRPDLLSWGYLIIYLPPLIWGYFKLRKYRKTSAVNIKKTASRSQFDFKIVDAGIMNGFETLTKLGGYIMLFSILSAFLQMLPFSGSLFKVLLSGILEVTNGIHIAARLTSLKTKFCIIIGFTVFGGICGIAQTYSMIKDTGLSLKFYVRTKLLFTCISTLAAWLFLTYHCI